MEGEILESSINLPVRTPTHVRNQGGPAQGTFGSNKPAEHERKTVNKQKKNIVSFDGYSSGESLTTKTSVLEKQRTTTPTSFVNVMPLQNYITDNFQTS